MFYIYNLLQAILLPIFSPFICIFVLCSKKYRSRTPARLGYNIAKINNSSNQQYTQTYWIHALSVGEVKSALPLIQELRNQNPGCRIILSVTTKSGRQMADTLLTGIAHHIIDGPFDIFFVVKRFIKHISPSCFILVETDFWPNILTMLRRCNIPVFLVNGRISNKSFARYKLFHFFFYPQFNNFSALCMQTRHDKDKMTELGISPQKIHTLGNLKFDTDGQQNQTKLSYQERLQKILPTNKTIFIAGSTHPGEEKIILDTFSKLKKQFPELFLIIAPRHIDRAREILELGRKMNLSSYLRSDNIKKEKDFFIIDTIGELAACYKLSDIAFVGGSMVPEGGHNPIEPAVFGKTILFGKHMDDFSEIAARLLQEGGALSVESPADLTDKLRSLLTAPHSRQQMGQRAHAFVQSQRGVIRKHTDLIQSFL